MFYIYLMIGGAVGTLARFGLGAWIHSWAGFSFPWGTFAINILGSFLLGLAIRGAEVSALSPELRSVVTVGFCGAFTTFSTFTFESITLLQSGAWGRAALYAFGSLALGLTAMAAGLLVVDSLATS